MRKMTFIILCSIVSIATVFGNGNKEVISPLKVSIPKIENMEYVEYGVYQGGEKTSIFKVVTETGENYNTLYFQQVIVGDFIQNIPKNYKDYSGVIRTDTKTGRMAEYSGDWEQLLKSNDWTGRSKEHLIVDEEKQEILFTQEIWDGFESKSKVARSTIEKGIPVFTLTTISLDNLRYFDLKNGGNAYISIPDKIADPILGTLNIEGEETIETPSGTYDTYKVVLSPGNSFIKKLLGPLSKAFVIWVEKGGNHRTVKSFIPGGNQTYILEKVSRWSN